MKKILFGILLVLSFSLVSVNAGAEDLELSMNRSVIINNVEYSYVPSPELINEGYTKITLPEKMIDSIKPFTPLDHLKLSDLSTKSQNNKLYCYGFYKSDYEVFFDHMLLQSRLK